MDDRYYTEEINYLLEQGKEFARKHPQKARMLHLDDIRSRDPNVERLIESFAFLTSRIRKRLDDDFSQIAEGLLSLMWPGHINPVPSFCLLEFRPRLWDFTEAVQISEGAEIDSEPTSENIRCRFKTCFPTSVLPIELSDVSVESEGNNATLKLSFLFANETNLASLAGHKLKIQLVGEFSICWQLYNLILGKTGNNDNVEQIDLTAFNAEHKIASSWKLGPEVLTPVGLTKEESLLSQGKTVLWSFGLIKDFFIFPEKYQAFRLDILDNFANQSDVSGFDISIRIKEPWPSNLRIRKEFFHINTVPIVNLFERDADPIRLDRLRYQYTVRGDIKHPEYFQVHSVDSVESIEVGTSKRKTYKPLYTSHSIANSVDDKESFYTLNRTDASWGGWETYINFVDSTDQEDFPEEEVVSLSLTCSNGRLPDQLLPDQINDPVSQLIDNLRPTNISHPTQFVLPDIEKNTLWRWLSHASFNYLSLSSKQQLKSLLRIHDFSNSDANRHKIEGIKSINMKPTRSLFKGTLVPGMLIEIVVNEEHYSDQGEIQSFAQVLSAFMSSYASINSYIQLSLTSEPSKHNILIQPRLGESFHL